MYKAITYIAIIDGFGVIDVGKSLEMPPVRECSHVSLHLYTEHEETSIPIDGSIASAHVAVVATLMRSEIGVKTCSLDSAS